MVCNGLTPSQREEGILHILDDISTTETILDSTTPQNIAFDWLVNIDSQQICPSNSIDAEQRSILSVIYYARGRVSTCSFSVSGG